MVVSVAGGRAAATSLHHSADDEPIRRDFPGLSARRAEAEGAVDDLGEGAPLAQDEAPAAAKAKFARASGRP
jgi:hypothetical protein